MKINDTKLLKDIISEILYQEALIELPSQPLQTKLLHKMTMVLSSLWNESTFNIKINDDCGSGMISFKMADNSSKEIKFEIKQGLVKNEEL